MDDNNKQVPNKTIVKILMEIIHQERKNNQADESEKIREIDMTRKIKQIIDDEVKKDEI